MRTYHRVSHVALLASAAGLLSACGGSSPLGVASRGATSITLPAAGSTTFDYTGTEQRFIVPHGITKLRIVALGAAGAGVRGAGCDGSCFGRGGRVEAEIPVVSGDELYVNVGGKGGSVTGGFNGGGNPGITASYGYGNGGGGASDIREGGHSMRHRIFVAAGGGGEGFGQDYNVSIGGDGGGTTGKNGAGQFGQGGSGGSQAQGGVGGAPGGSTGSASGEAGGDGALGAGGYGGSGGVGAHYEGGSGGGGGGGYFGGGGGGGSGAYRCCITAAGGGGGGGSSFVEPNATHVRMWTGWKKATDNGLVVIGWQ